MKKPETKEEWKEFLRQRDAALRENYYRELRALTDEEALRKLRSLVPVEEPWRQQPEWSGLVEQQRIFHRRREG